MPKAGFGLRDIGRRNRPGIPVRPLATEYPGTAAGSKGAGLRGLLSGRSGSFPAGGNSLRGDRTRLAHALRAARRSNSRQCRLRGAEWTSQIFHFVREIEKMEAERYPELAQAGPGTLEIPESG